jgi:AcrR family transcriptional regulator
MANYAPGIATKCKIINSAKELFYERGYLDVTMKDICDHSGVRRTLFFHYFKDKAELGVFIMTWANSIYASKSLEIIKKNMSHLSNLVKELVYDGMLFRSSVENTKVGRLYAEISLDVPMFHLTDENEEKLRHRFDMLGIEKSAGEITMASAYIAGATYMMLARYLNKTTTITDRQFVEQLVGTSLAVIAPDYPEKDKAVAEAIEAIYAYDIDFDAIFHERYSE